MLDTLVVILAILISGLFVFLSDRYSLRRGFFPAGTIVFSIFTLTYGLGWFLWRLDPDSLFGYSTQSTLSGLRRMGLSFSLGIFTLSVVYSVVRTHILPSISLNYSPIEIRSRNSKRLVRFTAVILITSGLLVPYLYQVGMFSRDAASNGLQVSAGSFAILLAKGTTLLSRLLPVALLLLSGLVNRFSRALKLAAILSTCIFMYTAYLSGSRTLLFTVPAYLLIGYFFWYRPRFSRVFFVLALLLSLSLPLAEHIRVQREGDPTITDLRTKYQPFQIGKQLIGTSHDFYLYLDAKSCQADLSILLADDPLTRQISLIGVRSFPPDSFQRWHVSGRLLACSTRKLEKRLWRSLQYFPVGLLPKTLGFSGPSLFDGQELSLELSRTLDLKPGEISSSTLSLFADSWWRYRWLGVTIAFSFLGLFLALIQVFVDYQIAKGAISGLLSQLLLFTLLGSWINNTALTTLWLLFWELPKSLLICYLIVVVIGWSRRNSHA